VYNVPATLVGGGTILSAGETDQLVITVQSAGTWPTLGSKSISVAVDGTEVNSGEPRSDTGATNVMVQAEPDLDFVSILPSTVSRGSSVAFAVTIANNATNGATATLDRATTRLRFGGGLFDVSLQPASQVDISAGAQVTLLFTNAVINPAIPALPQADAELVFNWTDNGRTDSETESIAGQITVQAAPDLSIVSVRSSRTTATAGQTGPWTITMVVRNTNGAPVDLDLSPAMTRLQLNVLGSGANVTSEYTIVPPTALEFAGGEILANGATDSLIFDVTQAGNTTGTIIVSGFVAGIDVNSSQPVSDNTGDGGSGIFILQSPGALSILSITPQRPTATVSQTSPYTIKMAVRNTGGSAIDLDLDAVTTTALTFSQPAGWATTVLPNLVGGGITLSGGETDTVVFNVNTTGSSAGTQTISGNVVGTELNTGTSRTDNTASGGTGSILVQTPAALVVNSAIPSPTTLTSGASTPWDVTIAIENTGQSAARLTLPAGLSISVQSTTPPASFNPVNALQEGGVVLAGGATGTLVAHAPSSPTFTDFGARAIGVSIDAVEINSNRPLNANNPTAGSVTAQTAPNLTAALQLTPTIVTRGAQAFLQVNVTNPGPNAAEVTLDRANTRVSFGGQYSAFLQLGSPDVIAADQMETLSFEDKLVPLSLTAGLYDLSVTLRYTANGITTTETEIITNGISVQNAPQFRITGIATSVTNVTAGQTQDWTATMTIVNEGSADVDIDFAVAKTYVRFLGPGGAVDPTYNIIQPTQLENG
ncbi:MAG TPA: hypothetical protein VFU38_10275, partial [Candidatus Krumholzibacteria bacterium]|nr:hypothetical protein [Candidatus Krumholzibacteria bacterium]